MASMRSCAGSISKGPLLLALGVAATTLVAGFPARPAAAERPGALPQDPNRVLVVDCLLPGQVRKLGGQMTYLAPRRPIKTTASDCEIRGGEYVAYDRANYQTALQVWMPQAESGDAEAQTYVGEIFERGLGRPSDYGEAARWYEKAAQQGYARAQINLAYLYEQGLGVPADPLKALNLYRQGSGITDDALTYASEVTAVRSEMQATIDDLTSQLEQQNSRVAELKSELDSSQSQLSAQRAALASARAEARNLGEQVAELKSQDVADPTRVAELKRLEAELTTREQRLAVEEQNVASLEAAAATQRAALADQLKSAAEKDLALRNQLADVTQSRNELQQQLVQTQRKLLDTEQQVARLRVDLTSERARITADKADLARQSASAATSGSAERAKMQAEIEARERRLAGQQEQIDKLLAQQRQYTAELEKLRSEQRTGSQAQQAQLASTRSELATTQRRLLDTEQRVADLTAQLEAERRQIALERDQLNRRAAAAGATKQAEIDALKGQLADRERRLGDQEKLIAALKVDSQRDQARIRQLEAMPVQQVAVRSTTAAKPMPAPLPPVPKRNIPPELTRGTYHALIIGNNNYQNMPKLRTAVGDAEALDDVLRTRYGFKTRVLVDASRAEILNALNDYTRAKSGWTLAEDDKLLIYYAGHGELDRTSNRGYWLPVNAQRDSNTEWISDDMISGTLNIIPARHVMVVADTCYAGTLTRSTGVTYRSSADEAAQMKVLVYKARNRSRTVLAAGGDSPVADSAGGDHSIFAEAILAVLAKNDRVLDGQALYNAIYDDVRRQSEKLGLPQDPRYDQIRGAGHRNGEFLFIPSA